MTQLPPYPETGFVGGPRLPQPTRTVLETEAAVSGVVYSNDQADRPPIPERLADLLGVTIEEASARYIAWLDWEAHCWQVFEEWAADRDLTPLGFMWDGECEPTFYTRGRKGR